MFYLERFLILYMLGKKHMPQDLLNIIMDICGSKHIFYPQLLKHLNRVPFAHSSNVHDEIKLEPDDVIRFKQPAG